MAFANLTNLSITQLMAYDNGTSYRLQFGASGIFVTVTHDPTIVCYWISKVTFLNYNTPPERAIVGVQTEGKCTRSTPRQDCRVDIIQLCVEDHCLIYQIHHATGNIPQQFREFLGDNRFTFVGMGIQVVSEILNRDYEIHFGERIRDLHRLYERDYDVQHCYFRMSDVSSLVLQMDYMRPSLINQSDWGAFLLHPDQVMYACADAVICYRAGIQLCIWNYADPPRNLRDVHDN